MDIREKIKQRRLQLLVHSCIYYKLDRTIISDETWNRWSEELKQLQLKYPDYSKEVEWYDAFKDWDGSTGAFLKYDNCVDYYRLLWQGYDEWVLNKAHKFLASMDRKISVIKSNKKSEIKKVSATRLF